MAESTGRDTARVEAFSDGVFAIAITLLVLEFKVPRLGPAATGAQVWAALRELWPSFVAFVGSFAAILIMWISHHGLFRMIRRVDTPFLYVNGFMLLLVTFVPFPTAVLAEYLGHAGERAAAAFYCGTFVVVSITFHLWWWTANRRRLLHAHVSPDAIARIWGAYRFGLAVYVAATLLSFWSAAAGLGICVALWIYWAVLSYRTEG
ncbi:MAG: TMEM175 family protein [Bacteroidota bacterium]